MMEEGKTDTTINTRLRALRALLNYLYDEGYVEEQAFNKVKLIVENRKIIETFSDSQIKTLVSKTDLNSFEGVRDRSIILILLDTGIRLRELTEMTISSVNFDDRLIKVMGKGAKERYVPFQNLVNDCLKMYLNKREKVAITNDLFINEQGKPLTRSGIYKRISKYGEIAGIKDVRVSPHTFRHTFAKFSVINGSDIFTLQHILGHSSMEMVRRYVNLYSKDIIDKHKQFSPVTNIFKEEKGDS